MKVKPLSRVRLFTTPWTAAPQAPPSMGFSRQEDCCVVNLFSVIMALQFCLMIVRSSWLVSMLCWSPDNDADFPWRIPCTHETSYPFINLDLGMHFLFPSTYPKLTVKLSQWLLNVRRIAVNASKLLSTGPCPLVSYPIINRFTDYMDLPASSVGLKISSQLGGYFFFLCPPTSQYSRSFGKLPSSYVQVRLAAGPQSHTFSGL